MTELYKALSAFQNDCPILYKEAEAGMGHFKYKYVELPEIIKVINPILSKHGLGFFQKHTDSDGKVGITTVVYHIESGDAIQSNIVSDIVQMKGMNDYQSLGSLSTYLRRYDLSAILGLVTEKDTDASGTQKPAGAKKETLVLGSKQYDKVLAFVKGGGAITAVEGKYILTKEVKLALTNASK